MDEQTLHSLWQYLKPETIAKIYLDTEKWTDGVDDDAALICESIDKYMLSGYVLEEQARFDAILAQRYRELAQ